MFNLFNKSKVRAGKQNNEEKKPVAAAAGKDGQNKKQSPFAALGKTWAKLNNMDRKQAYTWGAIAVVVLVALFTLGSAMGSASDDDFYDFETRGYDLANMPFSSDEAEQYLLASKYPDMQDTGVTGLYSQSEKEARQAEDAEEAAQLDTSVDSTASEYIPGRYYGGGAGAVSPTQVGSLNSASLRSASGSGVSGTFGPSGDFSNFRSQDKGSDTFSAQGRGSGNARKALYQSAVGSRAAAGQKDSRLLNAKKAMMGGNVKGSDAFLSDSGAVDLSKAGGLNLDPNAPVSSVDPGLFNDALDNANNEAQEEAAEEEEDKFWRDLAGQLIKMGGELLKNIGQNYLNDVIADARATHAQNAADYQEWINQQEFTRLETGTVSNETLNSVMSNSQDAKNFMDVSGLSYPKGEEGVNYNTLVDKKGTTIATKSKDGSWTYASEQGITLQEKQASKFNNKTQRQWERDNKADVKAIKKEIKAENKTEYFNRYNSGYNNGNQNTFRDQGGNYNRGGNDNNDGKGNNGGNNDGKGNNGGKDSNQEVRLGN